MAGEPLSLAGMRATIWHNPRCSKSRAALAILEAAGADVTVIDYLTHPPTPATLSRLYGLAGIRPADALRLSEPGAAILREADDTRILDAMSLTPALIERPLVETERGVRLARPPETVREIL